MKLLEKTHLGGISLKNRMAMAAMTRGRTDSNGLVGDMTVAYYAQRASAGLLFTESIRISEDATGSPLTPGIFTDQQIEAWKNVTTAVHDKGGVIIAQLCAYSLRDTNKWRIESGREKIKLGENYYGIDDNE